MNKILLPLLALILVACALPKVTVVSEVTVTSSPPHRLRRRQPQGHPQRGDRSQAGMGDAARIQPFADFVFHRREFGRAQRRVRDTNC